MDSRCVRPNNLYNLYKCGISRLIIVMRVSEVYR